MPRLLVIRFLFSLLLGLPHLALADATDAQKAEQTRKQLEQTQKDLKELQQLLRQIEQEKSGLQKQLKQTETEMGTMEQQIRELKQKIDSDESALKQLDEYQNQLQNNYAKQQQKIARLSRATWQSGGQSAPLRLLLNGSQPEGLTRTLTYYRYLSQARQREINQLNTTLSELDEVRGQTLERQMQLAEERQRLDGNYQKLAKLYTEREQVLKTLNQRQQNSAAKLKTSQQEQAQLAQVLQTLETALARQAAAEAEARAKAQEQIRAQAALALLDKNNAPQASYQTIQNGPISHNVQNSPFAQTRGKLPWPLSGQLLARYGSPRGNDARVTWDGVLIGAAEGSLVQAIHPGQVVLADYLSGMGLMLIINHGNNYLSLYGHNQSLLKKVGDLVQAGEPIATVGKSGGLAEPALYFAIRHQKTPSDPAQWCIAQNQPH